VKITRPRTKIEIWLIIARLPFKGDYETSVWIFTRSKTMVLGTSSITWRKIKPYVKQQSCAALFRVPHLLLVHSFFS